VLASQLSEISFGDIEQLMRDEQLADQGRSSTITAFAAKRKEYLNRGKLLSHSAIRAKNSWCAESQSGRRTL
jgi:hypothetical protein